MRKDITIKNQPNWLIAIILPFALLILIFIIVVILPLISFQKTWLITILKYLLSAIPFVGFFLLFLYIWLWQTFGKTILKISSEKIEIRFKNKLFNKPKEYLKTEIEEVTILDLGIEKSEYYIRLNNLFSDSNYSIVIQKENENIRIADWLTKERAENILETINSTMNIKNKDNN